MCFIFGFYGTLFRTMFAISVWFEDIGRLAQDHSWLLCGIKAAPSAVSGLIEAPAKAAVTPLMSLLPSPASSLFNGSATAVSPSGFAGASSGSSGCLESSSLRTMPSSWSDSLSGNNLILGGSGLSGLLSVFAPRTSSGFYCWAAFCSSSSWMRRTER